MTNLANVKNAGWEVAGGRKLRSSDVDTSKKANGVTKQSKEAQLLKMPKLDTLRTFYFLFFSHFLSCSH
jgi:hypothetical protein